MVTGAASGIGAALAVELARRGSRLVLLDRDAERLAKVAAPLDAETRVVDLADGAAVVAVGEDIRAAHPRLRLMVNNAGIALGGRFDQVTLAQYEQVIDVNFRAVVRLTHTLLPALRAEPGRTLSTSRRCSGWSRRPARPRTRRASSPSAVSPRRCARSWPARWR